MNWNVKYLIAVTTVNSNTTMSCAAELLMDVHNPFLIYESDENELNIITPWDIVIKSRSDDLAGKAEQRMLKMMMITDDRHFSYENEIELVRFIASEMQEKGLDLNNEENLDGYLNTKFM